MATVAPDGGGGGGSSGTDREPPAQPQYSDPTQDIQRIDRAIMDYVDNNDLKQLFSDMHDPFTDVDEILCIQIATIVAKMPESQKTGAVNQLVNLVQHSRMQNVSTAPQYQQVVDAVLLYLVDHEILPLSSGLAALIITCDFTLKSELQANKWQLIARNWDKLDTKGIRHVFKTLVEALSSLPAVISSERRGQLIPVEKVLLEILSSVPPIFTMTELSRNRTPNNLFVFPSVVEKIAEIKAYFRSLADLIFVVGRTFLYPLMYHPQFNATSSSWRVDSSSSMFFSNIYSYLPNRKEILSEQNYLFYMVVRQPRGREPLMQMMRYVRSYSKTFEGLLYLLISDTMAADECLPPDVEIPRYQWDHLLSIILFAVQSEYMSVIAVLGVLSSLLEKRKYRRARDEVMWLMLQVVGSTPNQNGKEVLVRITDLYKTLYGDDTKFVCASDHSSQMVRFLSSACIFILMEKADNQQDDSVIPPTEGLAQQINFVKELAKNDNNEESMMAILTNAFRSDAAVFRKVFQRYNEMLDGFSSETPHPFLLPYGRTAFPRLHPYDIQLIDSFAIRAKLHVLQMCQKRMLNSISPNGQGMFPSPASIETFARLLYTLEYDFGLKQFMIMLSNHNKAQQSQQHGMQHSIMIQEGQRDMLYLLLDILAYRLSNINLSGFARLQICLNVMASLHQLQNPPVPPGVPMHQTLPNLDLYYICEQVFMRLFSWIPLSETLELAKSLIAPERSASSKFCFPQSFNDPTDTKFHLCPEIVRMLFISLLRSMKIIGLDLQEDLALIYARITTVFTWAPSQLKSFPAACESIPTMIDASNEFSVPEHVQSEIHSDYVQLRGLETAFPDYIFKKENQNLTTIYCVIFRALIAEEIEFAHRLRSVYYHILERMNGRQHTVATNLLTDYVILQCGGGAMQVQDPFQNVVSVLITMMFHFHVLRLDRLFLSLTMHPSNDQKSQIAMLLIQCLLETPDVSERLTFYTATVPRKEDMPKEYFEAVGMYHKKFPEYTYTELLQSSGNYGDPQINSRYHYPSYYGSLIERLLPLVDHIINRAMELNVVDQVFSNILKNLGPLYKYHPSPISFVYSVLHSQHSHIGHSSRARHFILSIFRERPDIQLTSHFVQFNHQKVPLDCTLTDIVKRIIECSEFQIKPPEYVSQDWRFCELSPAAQAFYMSCIELLGSPHHPPLMVESMVCLLCSGRQARERPYTSLNAVALLLTALPDVYGNELMKMFMNVVETGAPNELKFEDIVYDNYEENVLLRMSNKPMIINALLQAFYHHGNQLSIPKFTKFSEAITKLINTEKEMWYYIRLMLPLQQWVFESKTKHQLYEECIRQVKGLMLKMGDLAEKGVQFEHGEELCDLFYHLKYMCVGDSLTKEAEQMINKLPPHMRHRMRYYVRGKSDEDSKTEAAQE